MSWMRWVALCFGCFSYCFSAWMTRVTPEKFTPEFFATVPVPDYGSVCCVSARLFQVGISALHQGFPALCSFASCGSDNAIAILTWFCIWCLLSRVQDVPVMLKQFRLCEIWGCLIQRWLWSLLTFCMAICVVQTPSWQTIVQVEVHLTNWEEDNCTRDDRSCFFKIRIRILIECISLSQNSMAK